MNLLKHYENAFFFVGNKLEWLNIENFSIPRGGFCWHENYE